MAETKTNTGRRPEYVVYRIQRDWTDIKQEILDGVRNGAPYPSVVVVEPGKGHANDPSFISWAHDHHIQVIAYQNGQTQDANPRNVPYAFLDVQGNPIEDKEWEGEYSGDMLASPWLKQKLLERSNRQQDADKPLHEILADERTHQTLKSMLADPAFRAEAVQHSALAEHLLKQGKAQIDRGFDGANYDNFGRWLNLDGNKKQVDAYIEKYGGLPERDVVALLNHLDERLDAYKAEKTGVKNADFSLFSQNFEEGFIGHTATLKRELADGSVRLVAGLMKEDLWVTGDGAKGGIESDRLQGNKTKDDVALVRRVMENGFPVIAINYATQPDTQEVALKEAQKLAAQGPIGIAFGEESHKQAVPLHHPGMVTNNGTLVAAAPAAPRREAAAGQVLAAAAAPVAAPMDEKTREAATVGLARAIQNHLNKYKDPARTVKFFGGREEITVNAGGETAKIHPKTDTEIMRGAYGAAIEALGTTDKALADKLEQSLPPEYGNAAPKAAPSSAAPAPAGKPSASAAPAAPSASEARVSGAEMAARIAAAHDSYHEQREPPREVARKASAVAAAPVQESVPVAAAPKPQGGWVGFASSMTEALASAVVPKAFGGSVVASAVPSANDEPPAVPPSPAAPIAREAAAAPSAPVATPPPPPPVADNAAEAAKAAAMKAEIAQTKATVERTQAFAGELGMLKEAVGGLNDHDVANDAGYLNKLQTFVDSAQGKPAQKQEAFKEGDFLKRQASQHFRESLGKALPSMAEKLKEAKTPEQVDELRKELADTIAPSLAQEHIGHAPDAGMQAAKKQLQHELKDIRKAVSGLNNHKKHDDAGHMQTLDGFVKRTEAHDKDHTHGLEKQPKRGDYLSREASAGLRTAVGKLSKDVETLLGRDDATRQQLEEARHNMAKAIEDNMRDDEVRRREEGSQKKQKHRER